LAKYWCDAEEPALWRQNPQGRLLQVASGAGKKALSDAWRRSGIGGAEREQKRAQARAVYEGSYRKAEKYTGLIAAVSETSPRHPMNRCFRILFPGQSTVFRRDQRVWLVRFSKWVLLAA
jgi:hypothetical protein